MAAQAPDCSDQPTILIVEDNPTNTDILRLYLKANNYRLQAVETGEAALAQARSEPPDLILLDLMLDDMDGFEVCATLKQEPRFRDTPVIFISAGLTQDKLSQVFEVGGIDYICKPMRHLEINLKVRNCLRLRALERQASLRLPAPAFCALAETLNHAVGYADAQGQLLYANQAWYQTLGLTASTELAQSFAQLTEADRGAVAAQWCATGQQQPWQRDCQRVDGQPLRIQIAALPSTASFIITLT